MTSDKKFEGEERARSESEASQGAHGASGEPTAEAGSAKESASGRDSGGADEAGQLKAEVAELKDRLLRTHAEMDNVRKRLEREKTDQAKFAITKFARDVLSIGDNVQRAIDAVPQRSLEDDPALKSFFEGVTMIERELVSVLGKHGIKRLDPKGEPFDPNFHQAVVEVPSSDVPAGRVTQVFQSGYMIEDRVLRPAMVAVSKGGPKVQAPADAVTPGTSAPGGAENTSGHEGGSSASDADGASAD